MTWFGKTKDRKTKVPEGLWIKCNYCREIIYRKEVEKNGMVCPKCNYHFSISVEERIALILDEGTFKERESQIYPSDPLNFKDSIRYRDRLKNYQKKTGTLDALTIGEGKIDGHPVVLGVFNFKFMGGSMGSVVGEKILRAVDLSLGSRSPLIIASASGGARMQEGIFSLLQMSKTSAAMARLSEAGIPYISVLTDPTFGGVTASFAMLGDVLIAEPKSLIGFAGPRVVEQTIKQQLPEGFQRAEFLLEHGMLDMIVERKKLKETLSRLLAFLKT
jgi:acetyl-CoA carboxylase carboxyl transferase subunit beta